MSKVFTPPVRLRFSYCLGSALLLASGCGADPATTGVGGDAPVVTPAAGAGSIAGAGATTGAGGGTTPIGGNQTPIGSGSTTVAPEGSAGVCQQFTIDSGRITPDMLIVLDRSTSMRNEGVDRWTPSVSGLKSITSELDDVIRFGLMAFPGRGTATLFGDGMSCAPGTLEVPIALNAAPAIATSLDGLTLIQSTPTASTLMAAHTVLGTGMTAVDDTTAAKFVILVTDGSPNCSNGVAGGGRGGGGDAAAVAASVAAIAAMQKDGIRTYVLGYGTQADANLKSALDMMAQAGGTGDTQHRPIENEAGLVAEFRKIINGAVTCEFALTTTPSDPNFVLVQIDGQKLDLNSPDGFTLSPDRKKLTVQGSACGKLQSDTEQHMLTVKVECERQTPLF